MSGRGKQLKRAIGLTALLAAGIVSALATGAGASAVPGTTTAPTTPTTTASTTTAPPAGDLNGRLAYRLLLKVRYGPVCKQQVMACFPPLKNMRAKIYDANKRLIRNVLTNSKGRVYIDFPRKDARYTMTISHAPINGTRLAVKTSALRTPFFGRSGVAEQNITFCLSLRDYEC